MYDTDEVAVGRLGIRLTAGQQSAMGLSDGTRAWGVWVEGCAGREQMRMTREGEPEFDPNQQGPHLVVSTMHPDVWAGAMRIEARLQREDASLEHFLNTLAEMGINILSLDTAVRGFKLMIVEAIVNVPRLSVGIREMLLDLDRRVSALSSSDIDQQKRLLSRREVFKSIGERVISCASVIEARLRHADAKMLKPLDNRNGFFHRSSRRLGMRPWFLAEHDLPSVARLERYARHAGLLDSDGGLGYEDLLKETADLLVDREKREVQQMDNRRPTLAGRRIQEPVPNRDWFACPDREGESEEMCERLWTLHSKPPVTVRGLPTLGYARVWRAYVPENNAATAMPFVEFQAKGRLIECIGAENKGAEDGLGRLQDDMFKLTGAAQEERPLWFGRWTAFAAYHHQERSLRFRLLRPWFSRRYAWRIEIPYLINTGYDSVGGEPRREMRSSGLLRCIVGSLLDDANTRIEQLKNALVKLTSEHEEGVIRLVVVPERSARPLSEREFEVDFKRRVEHGLNKARYVYRGEYTVEPENVRVISLHDIIERAW